MKTLTVVEKTFVKHKRGILVVCPRLTEVTLLLLPSQGSQYKHAIIFASAYGTRLITPPLALYRSAMKFQSEIHSQM